jgi:hypothetical protein
MFLARLLERQISFGKQVGDVVALSCSTSRQTENRQPPTNHHHRHRQRQTDRQQTTNKTAKRHRDTTNKTTNHQTKSFTIHPGVVSRERREEGGRTKKSKRRMVSNKKLDQDRAEAAKGESTTQDKRHCPSVLILIRAFSSPTSRRRKVTTAGHGAQGTERRVLGGIYLRERSLRKTPTTSDT